MRELRLGRADRREPTLRAVEQAARREQARTPTPRRIRTARSGDVLELFASAMQLPRLWESEEYEEERCFLFGGGEVGPFLAGAALAAGGLAAHNDLVVAATEQPQGAEHRPRGQGALEPQGAAAVARGDGSAASRGTPRARW